MSPIVVVFPGQGSQYVGMGERFLNSDFKNIAEEHYGIASDVLGYDAKKLGLEGPEDKIKQTEITQPLIVNHSTICFQILKKFLDQESLKISNVLGHSVGEYSALVAAGSLKFEDALKATQLRGRSMQDATPLGTGKMVAVLRVPLQVIETACNSTQEIVSPANINGPDQVVISGSNQGCDEAVKYIQDHFEGRARFVELPVSAPFHCALMEPAKEKMNAFFSNISLEPNKIAYTANIDAKTYESGTSVETIKQNLLLQIPGSVQWLQSVNALPSNVRIIEVSPNKILKGLIKKINKDLPVFSFEEESDLNKVFNTLSEFIKN